MDGFRYDCVPDYWDGPATENSLNLVISHLRGGALRRALRGIGSDSGAAGTFADQCAEQLEDPTGWCYTTYSNATWQNETLNAARAVAPVTGANCTTWGSSLGLDGYPASDAASPGHAAETGAFR